MVNFKSKVSNYEDVERMAAEYLAAYFDNTEIIYPLSAFKMLKDEGIDFVIRNFNKLDGVYIYLLSHKMKELTIFNVSRYLCSSS